MKRLLNDNNGYALVTVLFIITIFTILSLAFLTQSTTSMKQNGAVETKSQSVDLAEMGAAYFQQIVLNELYSINENAPEQTDITMDSAVTMVKNFLNQRLIETPAVPLAKVIDTKSSASFAIDHITVTKDKDKISITYASNGMEDNATTRIDGTLIIDVGNWITIEKEATGENEGNPNDMPTGNKINDPGSNLATCPKNVYTINFSCQLVGTIRYDNNDQLVFNGAVYKVTGELYLPNMNYEINRSTLYILGKMTTENMNSQNYVSLHVSGDGTFGHFNGNGLNYSTLEIGGNGKMDNTKLYKSSIYIGGTGEIGQINGMVDSKIYIGSNATIKGIDIGDNSKICVNGKLTIENNYNNNSNGKSNVYAKSSNDPRVITDSTKFATECPQSSSGGEDSGNTQIIWGTPKIIKEFDYHY
ncbi:hypothetical protein OEV98_10685 [Caldibacillus lycopersici]|uniref:Type 4 fimbrial biogenesis protein PilX N-terminal domain-containing protein n=1 Tax=Perspicuibacillus lycopersici TaxID=1325689 RepID=A0AAE3ITT5_9BACI|nr:hypothetical protein [Perspicuibacillus lycopersici]MCU9614027.1 hypothetical protein [Perspicuibacillus lycopersici]